MNNNAIKKALEKEHKNIEAPGKLKSRVSKSIDHLLILKALIELYGNIPVVVIQSLAYNKKRGDTHN
jgi:hypothetical protein